LKLSPLFTIDLLFLLFSLKKEHKVTVVHIVPPLAILLIKHPLVSQHELSSLRFIFCGAAPLSGTTHVPFLIMAIIMAAAAAMTAIAQLMQKSSCDIGFQT